MSIPSQLLTLDDFLALPETKPAFEFVDGRIIQKMSPKFQHSRIEDQLSQRINDKTEPRKVGVAFPELRCTFAGRSLVFDVAYFEWSRLPLDEDGELPESDARIPPDLAVEIRSPGQGEAELAEKLRFAVSRGTQLGWLINSRTRRVKVFRPGERVVTLEGDDVLQGGKLVGGFRCTINELFGWLKLA